MYDYYAPGETHPGRLKSVTQKFESGSGQPDITNYMNYTTKGQLWRTWGDTTIPVENSYDEYGQLVAFRTYRNAASVASWSSSDAYDTTPTPGGDSTQIAYDEATGLSVSRTDAQNNKREFDYTPWGTLTTFTNARGQASTFDYDPIKAQLASVTFDGEVTPMCSMTMTASVASTTSWTAYLTTP